MPAARFPTKFPRATRAAALGLAAVTVAASMVATAEAQQQQQRPAQAQQQQRPAQQQQPPAPPPPQVVNGFGSGWAKVCQQIQGTNQQGCLVSNEVFGENGAFLTSVSVQEPQPDQRRQLIMIVPLGIALQGGLTFRLDAGRAQPLKVGTCLPNGCFAGLDLGDDILRPMRTATSMFVTIRTAQGIAIDVAVPMQGFAAAFDGQAMTTEQLQERQRAFQQRIVEAQERARRQMQEQQQQQPAQPGATPPAAPAQPAPAQPATPQR